jgi:signal transduction histidine kinase
MVSRLLDTAPRGFVTLCEDGIVLRANSTLAGWLDIPIDDLTGRRFETLLSVGGKVFYQTHLFPLLKLNGHCEELFLTFRTAKGDDVPVLVNGVELQTEEGFEYSVVLVRMRQRERYEEELLLARRAAEKANVQLAEANLRLQALDRLKDELLAVTSHDIGGLVTTIRLSAQLMMRQKPGSNVDTSRHVRAISDATDRLLVLLRDLSDLALINTGQITLEPTRLSLSEVAQTVIGDLRVRAEAKSISVSLEATEDEPYIDADYDRLYQVIANLLVNAIKFTPAEGRVVLKVQRHGERLALSVQDSGVGIPQDRLPDLFRHFRNESSPGTGGERGSGLGLAIVRRLVELHGGEITVSSVEGSGSTFTVLLAPEGH